VIHEKNGQWSCGAAENRGGAQAAHASAGCSEREVEQLTASEKKKGKKRCTSCKFACIAGDSKIFSLSPEVHRLTLQMIVELALVTSCSSKMETENNRKLENLKCVRK
jgi:hypothetical protein